MIGLLCTRTWPGLHLDLLSPWRIKDGRLILESEGLSPSWPAPRGLSPLWNIEGGRRRLPSSRDWTQAQPVQPLWRSRPALASQCGRTPAASCLSQSRRGQLPPPSLPLGRLRCVHDCPWGP